MSSKASDTVKFFVGCFVIYLVWQLHKMGFFYRIGDLLTFGHRGGFSGVTTVILGVVPVVVDAIIVVGSVALTFYGMVWKAISPVAMKLLRLLDAKLEEYGIDLIEFDGEDK